MPRLGDDIDDYCTRCKRHTNHSIAALNGDEAVKVICRSCNSEHQYRHNESGKKEMTAQAAFNKVLESVSGQMGSSTPEKPKRKR